MLRDHDPEQVKQLAEDILDREEFRAGGESLLDRIGRWIADHVSFGRGGTGGSGGSGILTVLLLVAAVALLGWAIWVLVRQPRRRRSKGERPPEPEVVVVRSTRQWDEAAARHEAAGEWKEAMRCRFASLVQRLADDGAIAEMPGRTTGELRVDVRVGRPWAGADFEQAAELFERAWYGDLSTGPEEAGRFAEHARRSLEPSA